MTGTTSAADWLASAVIFHAKQVTSEWITLFTFGTVYLAIFIVKTASAYWLVALAAEKTAHVKGVLHCIHHLLMASQ